MSAFGYTRTFHGVHQSDCSYPESRRSSPLCAFGASRFKAGRCQAKAPLASHRCHRYRRCAPGPATAGRSFAGTEKRVDTNAGGIAAGQLRSYIERIERLEDEKAALAADIREIYSEARGNGFDVRAMRQLIRLRRLDAQDRAEREALLDLYRSAVGV